MWMWMIAVDEDFCSALRQSPLSTIESDTRFLSLCSRETQKKKENPENPKNVAIVVIHSRN